MTATTPVLPALMTETLALLLLDEARGRLDKVLDERMDCGDCKAAGTGWCETDNSLYLASEEIGRALAQARACRSDYQAREIVTGVMDRLSDRKRFGDASEVAFFGTPGGER